MSGERIQAFGAHPFGKIRSVWRNIGISGLLVAVVSMICQQGVAEPKRIAVVPANGPFAKANVAVAMGENRAAEALASKLNEKPGIVIIDRAHVDELIKEQNFQNMDRSSSDSAAKIGKLVGAGQIVMVEIVGATQSTRQERTATSLKTIGTITAEVTARAIDVESGVVLAQPTSRFEDSAVVTEMKTWPVPKTVGDPQVGFNNLWT